MAADDKESDERRQSRSLERERGRRRRRHRSTTPSPPKQRRKRSRSPGAEEKHRHKNSAEKHEDSKGHELSNRKPEGMSEEDSGREVARKNGDEDEEKAGARKSSKEDRKVELHSSGDSSEDGFSDSESDKGRKKKSKSRNHKSRKSKSKHHRLVRSESEQDESQTEGTSGESSEDSEEEYRRAKRRKRRKQKEKAERERKEERRRKKEKKRKMKEKEREQEHRKKKKEKVEERGKGPITESWGEYGIIEEPDMWTRRPEFSAWLAEVKKVNLETLTNQEEKDLFKQYMDDYKKYYNIDIYHHRKVIKQTKNKQSEHTEFNNEEQRWQELRAEQAKMKETELDKITRTMMETGMGKATRDQAVLQEEMQCHYRLGNTEVCNQEKDHDVGDCLEGDNMHRSEVSNIVPILGPNHKIFLSHSGAQKEFAEHLCKALEDRLHYPFFDRRPESLPKGERFPGLIVRAVEQCEMLIVVVSNEYFKSKWPMIELSAFVKAHKLHHGSNIRPKILPLFYGLSVSDLDNEGMRMKWFQEWKTLAEADIKERIVLSDWKYALDVLGSFNGLSYDTNLKEVVAYIDKIVSHVCKSISPDIKWDDSHVQGKSNICKVIGEKISRVGVSQKYKVKVVGIYGVGGIGKTTACKTLCKEFSSKYDGRVCHIEFSSDSKELFRKGLRDLTRKSMEVIQSLDEEQCKDILRKSLFKQRTFLAIDNISDNHRSIEEAKMFLEVPYHMDSLVVVTAWSQSVLMLLGLNGDEFLEMPNLGEVDALKLFLHYVASGRQFFEDEEKHDIMTCIRRCYFSKGNGEGHHYHPLALKILGSQLRFCGENPCDWVENFPQLRTFNFFPGENPVFDILRSSFDLLPPRDQTLFMDVGCFFQSMETDSFEDFEPKLIEWLCFAHKQDEKEIGFRLEHLQRKGLLQEVDLRCGKISMHDLYLEFAKLEGKGSFKESTNLREWMWLYMEDGDLTELEHIPEGRCWYKLTRLHIKQTSPAPKKNCQIVDRIGGMEGMKWNYFSNVEVLQLSRLHLGLGVLNLEGLVNLRILELHEVIGIGRVEGLEKMKHLTYFQWIYYFSPFLDGTFAHIVGQLPSSLRRLFILFSKEESLVLELDILARCSNLSKLDLNGIEAHSLDLSNCWSLESVSLGYIRKLQTLSGLAPCPPSNLHSLMVYSCKDLVEIPGIDHLKRLKKLYIEYCQSWKMPSLFTLIELQDLSINGDQRLVGLAKDCFPRQLRKLQLGWSQSNEELNLTGFNQLEVLDLSWSHELTSLTELGDLPALQELNLCDCENLLRLPDLSLSKNLQELQLEGCYALELHEKDIQMLSKLPFLEPVVFIGRDDNHLFRLDFDRRKVLIHSSKYGAPRWDFVMVDDWEERDLGAPPIKIGRRGSWE